MVPSRERLRHRGRKSGSRLRDACAGQQSLPRGVALVLEEPAADSFSPPVQPLTEARHVGFQRPDRFRTKAIEAAGGLRADGQVILGEPLQCCRRLLIGEVEPAQ